MTEYFEKEDISGLCLRRRRVEAPSDSDLEDEEEVNTPSSPIFDIPCRRKRALDLDNESLSRTSNEPTNDVESPLSVGRRRRKGTIEDLEDLVHFPVEPVEGWKMPLSTPEFPLERSLPSPLPYKMKLIDISDGMDSPMTPIRISGRDKKRKDSRDLKEVLKREDMLGSFFGDDIIRKTAGFKATEVRRQPKYPKHGYYLKDNFSEPQQRSYSSEFQRILNEFTVWGDYHVRKRKHAPASSLSVSSRLLFPRSSAFDLRLLEKDCAHPYKSRKRKNSTVLIEYLATKRKKSSTHPLESLELKRKSTSFDHGANIRGLTELKGQFTVLERRWKNEDVECLVVVLKDCTTIHLMVQHPKILSSGSPRILEAVPKIFTKDHAFYDIFNLSIQFVLNHYECIEVDRFLCLLYIIYFDNLHFYKACKLSLEDKYSVQVNVLKDSISLISITNEGRGEVQIHLFTNSIRILRRTETLSSSKVSIEPSRLLQEFRMVGRKTDELVNKKREKREKKQMIEGLFNKRFIELVKLIAEYNLN